MLYTFRFVFRTATKQPHFILSHRRHVANLPSREAAVNEARRLLSALDTPGMVVMEEGVEVPLGGTPEWDNFLGPQTILQLMCGDVLDEGPVFLVRRESGL